MIRIRRFRRGETGVLERVFDGMSLTSRYLRYHAATPRLTAAYRRALANVDERRHVVLVAERLGPDGWRADGLGRLIAVSDRQAELAIEVVDARHRQGTGEAIVRALADAGRAEYAEVGGVGREPVEQRGLADAGRAPHHEGAARAGPHPGQEVRQPAPLGLPPQEVVHRPRVRRTRAAPARGSDSRRRFLSEGGGTVRAWR